MSVLVKLSASLFCRQNVSAGETVQEQGALTGHSRQESNKHSHDIADGTTTATTRTHRTQQTGQQQPPQQALTGHSRWDNKNNRYNVTSTHRTQQMGQQQQKQALTEHRTTTRTTSTHRTQDNNNKNKHPQQTEQQQALTEHSRRLRHSTCRWLVRWGQSSPLPVPQTLGFQRAREGLPWGCICGPGRSR